MYVMRARSRLGCTSCRRRKKKCDEVKPICTACLRNNLGCVWPVSSSQTTVVKVGSPSRQQTVHRNASKLDAWALSSANTHITSITAIPVTLSNFALPGSVASGSETWRLLDHYLKDTANRLVCLQDSQNPFLHTILPAALHDELLMNSILALSGVHMMQRLPQLNPEMQSLTWSSYTRALKQLRVALSEAFRDGSSVDAAWRALLVVVIFYLLEATRGNDPKAMQGHLEGAHHLMAYVICSESSPAESSIVSLTTELYVYNAALASFTTNCPPTPTSSPKPLTNNPTSPNGEIGVMCGCAYELFTFIPKVSALLWELAPHASAEESCTEDLVVQYHSLRAQIENWQPRSDQQQFVLCAELYQQSLLLLLDCRFARDASDRLVDDAFQSLQSLLARLPPTSPIATTATWPLFVFGIHAQSFHQKELIRSYFRSLVTVFGMGVMSTALNQLEEVWGLEPGQDVVNRFFVKQNEILLIC